MTFSAASASTCVRCTAVYKACALIESVAVARATSAPLSIVLQEDEVDITLVELLLVVVEALPQVATAAAMTAMVDPEQARAMVTAPEDQLGADVAVRTMRAYLAAFDRGCPHEHEHDHHQDDDAA